VTSKMLDDGTLVIRCPQCDGTLRFWTKLNPISKEEGTHRIYRCELCDRFEWVFDPPGKRT